MRATHYPLKWGILSIVGFCLVLPAFGKDVEEKFDDGSPHIRYRTDAKDRKIGDYQEFFPGGKVKVRGTYTADKKNGAWSTFSEDGKPLEVAHYRNGLLDGPYQWNFPSGHQQLKTTYHSDDFAGPITTYDEKGHTLLRLSYPRPYDMVLKAWQTLAPKERGHPKYLDEPHIEAPYKAGRIASESLDAGLKYVMLYRALSGLPFQNLTIDPQLCDLAQHGAVVLAKLGHLTHTPERPADMDEAFFKLAYSGCNQSNIYQGQASIFDAVDGFMDDSDASNIQKIGHRQWVLAPGLQRTGFGTAAGFTAMHVLSAAYAGATNFTFFAYPGEGYYPRALLHSSAAWSVHLNSTKAKVPSAAEVTIKVLPLDEHFVAGEPATATIVSVIPNDSSNWNVIVFQPQLKSFDAGRYLVEITGLRTPTGVAVPFSYLVDLKEMPAAGEEVKPAKQIQ